MHMHMLRHDAHVITIYGCEHYHDAYTYGCMCHTDLRRRMHALSQCTRTDACIITMYAHECKFLCSHDMHVLTTSAKSGDCTAISVFTRSSTNTHDACVSAWRARTSTCSTTTQLHCVVAMVTTTRGCGGWQWLTARRFRRGHYNHTLYIW